MMRSKNGLLLVYIVVFSRERLRVCGIDDIMAAKVTRLPRSSTQKKNTHTSLSVAETNKQTLSRISK